MPTWFRAAFAAGGFAAVCLSGCAAPNQARSQLRTATVPSEYRSPDGHFVVRLRAGTPATYQLVRVQDGRVLGRAESAIKPSQARFDLPTSNVVNVVFSPDDTQICVEEALPDNEDGAPASRYILFRHNLPAEYRDLDYATLYLQPEASMWTERVHYGEPYEWPQVLEIDRTTIRFYYPRSKQARNVSLDSVHSTDKPITQE